MRILISGGSGFIGTAVTEALRKDGHTVGRLVRPGQTAGPGDVRWDPNEASADMEGLAGAEAVVHLSGAGVADQRWTDARKRELRNSRIDSTRVLVDMLIHLPQKPRVFVCASAVGYYGDRADEVLTETSSYGNDFLGLLARDWEAEASRAAHAGIRTVVLRSGVVLSAQGGALPKMMQPFKLGLGGRLGSGKQWMAWVGFDDVIAVARAAVCDEKYAGPVNVVAPNPVRNEEFTKALARVLRRPAVFAVPAFVLRLALGEMAGMVLGSQRARPAKLLKLGYEFKEPELEPALEKMLGQSAKK